MKRITDKMRLDWLISESPTIYFSDERYPRWGDIGLTRRGIDSDIRASRKSPSSGKGKP